MNVTFDRRLKQRPVKSRLGKFSNGRKSADNDLRQKLSSKVRNPKGSSIDARSVLKRRRSLRIPARRDARSVLRKSATIPLRAQAHRVPFILPVKTVRNDVLARSSGNNTSTIRRPPFRRFSDSRMRNLLTAPIVAPVFPQNALPTELCTQFVNPADTLVSLSTTGTKWSPIQGFRVEIRNLQPAVTLDDVYELFSSVGALRLCNIVRPGQAEVVYNELSDAKEAVRRYNNRELDGRPMNVLLITQVPDESGNTTRFASRLGPKMTAPSSKKWLRTEPLQSGSQLRKTKPTVEVDMDVVRKALFNVSTGVAPRKAVDFNVSLR